MRNSVPDGSCGALASGFPLGFESRDEIGFAIYHRHPGEQNPHILQVGVLITNVVVGHPALMQFTASFGVHRVRRKHTGGREQHPFL